MVVVVMVMMMMTKGARAETDGQGGEYFLISFSPPSSRGEILCLGRGIIQIFSGQGGKGGIFPLKTPFISSLFGNKSLHRGLRQSCECEWKYSTTRNTEKGQNMAAWVWNLFHNVNIHLPSIFLRFVKKLTLVTKRDTGDLSSRGGGGGMVYFVILLCWHYVHYVFGNKTPW